MTSVGLVGNVSSWRRHLMVSFSSWVLWLSEARWSDCSFHESAQKWSMPSEPDHNVRVVYDSSPESDGGLRWPIPTNSRMRLTPLLVQQRLAAVRIRAVGSLPHQL